ncbi:hypothetical protein [Cellulomonas fengjieae]|uniref:hypothetical protein n=1 Tax=Cellulomonas fengjieae TaxID=2819978 RepID=UPI001AAF5A69|nr:hypothetical protein [Cellulomonas fengjieae]MBO3102174.1 hypothetical protein [Cellulomonas fengjieae]
MAALAVLVLAGACTDTLPAGTTVVAAPVAVEKAPAPPVPAPPAADLSTLPVVDPLHVVPGLPGTDGLPQRPNDDPALGRWQTAVSAFWPVARSMALGIAALALPLAGLHQLVGGKGFTVGAMTMMFLGNPLAGIATTGAWLPAGLGTFGQLLPPGATGALVRSAAYFGGAGGLVPALTLAAWVVVGAVLNALGIRRAATVGDAAAV